MVCPGNEQRSFYPLQLYKEVTNRFKGLDLIDRVPEELRAEVHDIVQETGITHGDPTSLAPHERLTDLAVVPREKPHTGAAAREQPRDSHVIER